MIPFDEEHKPPVAVMDDPDTELLVETLPSRQTVELDLPPSCIDFCDDHPRSCVVGTYYLEPQTTSQTTPLQQRDDQNERPAQKRRGSLTLFRFNNTGEL